MHIQPRYSKGGPMPYYPWPAAALDAEDMSALHLIRESSSPRMPITRLIKQAIREFCERNRSKQPDKPNA